MKTLANIDKTLLAFEKEFGLSIRGAEQGSAAWFNAKLGVISASNAHKAVSKKDTDKRLTYLCDLVAEVCTGVIEEVNSKHMEWGKDNEKAARSSYEFANNIKMTPLSFAFKDESFRVGCSPDGLIGDVKGAEIKCPWDSANYIKFLLEDDIKPEWRWQYQFCMWVLDADQWDMTYFDPRMKTHPIHTITFERDEKMQKQIEETVPALIEDMDKMLAKIGVKFGAQWIMLAEKQARETA